MTEQPDQPYRYTQPPMAEKKKWVDPEIEIVLISQTEGGFLSANPDGISTSRPG